MKQKLKTLFFIARLCGLRTALELAFAKLQRRDSIRLPLPTGKGDVICRLNNSDVVIFTSVFWGGEVRMPPELRPRTILDLGANAGLTTASFALQYPEAEILAVEPGVDNFSICDPNVSQFSNAKAVRKAAAAERGWLEIENPEAMAMAQTYRACDKAQADAVEALTMQDLLGLTTAARPVLVKMDIEGAEVEMFRRCESWINSVDAVLVEPHGHGTQALIEQALEANRFKVTHIGEKIYGVRLQ
jgi:FkbM family methyltransferase